MTYFFLTILFVSLCWVKLFPPIHASHYGLPCTKTGKRNRSIVYLALVYVCLIFLSDVTALQAQNSSEMLIPEKKWITDFEARLALARILAYDDHTLDESLKEYRIILKQKPGNHLVRLEMARALIRNGDAKEALSILRSIQAMHQNDPETLVALADLEASLGHAQESHDLYMDAIRVSDQPEIIKLKFADRMNMWGDFYKAEAIYREHLKTHPDKRELALKLAAVLRSSERYGESEGIYNILLFESPDSREILMGYARLKFLEKKF
jgi:predicted Zn-dependent protease